MKKHLITAAKNVFISYTMFNLFRFICVFSCVSVFAQSSIPVVPIADAYVRNGTYASTNYGSDVSLQVKEATTSYARVSYLKFPLNSVNDIASAKLRIYGYNYESTTTINISVFGVSDSWTEGGITWNNAPVIGTTALGSLAVNNVAKYYELDVTNYIKGQFSGDKIASFALKDAASQKKLVTYNSKENGLNQPQLVITTSGAVTSSNALLFIQNLDKFPANDVFVASRIQNPWTRDTVEPIVYNANHDTARIRIHNKGIGTLIINNLILSNTSTWQIFKLKGVSYSPSALPLTISSGTYADLQLLFIAVNQATRVKVLQDNLTIISNDDREPTKVLSLNGLYQRNGEGIYEPTAQEILNTFGFKTRTGFTATDPDKGANNKPKGDEILSSYFLRADLSRPVTVRQMGAYHSCCEALEFFRWYVKGSTTTPTSIFGHIGVDAQSLLPRRGTPNTPAEGSFTPAAATTAFGFRIGSKDHTDPLKNPDRKIGVRVWKALDATGRIIPNSYIVSNDYLGGQYTNYDYNDNSYFVSNIKPEQGTVHYSELSSTPSAVDFGEKLLQSANSFALSLKSLGQTYANGSSDPTITITSVVITGENKGEFTASMPAQTSLNPQGTTTLSIGFNPVSEGLKIAELLIYYNNSTPLRIPLYGIGKASGTTVSVPFRIKSGSSTEVTVNGNTWSSDTLYAFDNLEPFTNSQVTQISGTDEDVLYRSEQSSNGDKRPFRYEIPIANGSYVVRLHFAEIYWGNPSSTASTSLSGGPGSRVMSVSLENQLKLINLDVAQEVGSAAAIIKNIPVTVTDQKLNINFTATVNRPMVCAIEVYKFESGITIVQATMDSSRNMIPSEELSRTANDSEKPRVYPNPLNQKFNIQFPTDYKGKISLQIVDMTGRVYEIEKLKLKAGGTAMEVNLSRFNLKPGVYILKILSDTRKTEVVKLIVQ